MNYLLCVYTQVQILTGAIKFMHTRFSLWYLWEEENDDDIHVQNKWSFTHTHKKKSHPSLLCSSCSYWFPIYHSSDLWKWIQWIVESAAVLLHIIPSITSNYNFNSFFHSNCYSVYPTKLYFQAINTWYWRI